MKTFAKIAATIALAVAVVPAAFAQTPPANAPTSTAPATASTPAASGAPVVGKKMPTGRKGGYVHATTYTNKAGKTVHKKGFYRHSTKKAMTAKPATAAPTPKM